MGVGEFGGGGGDDGGRRLEQEVGGERGKIRKEWVEWWEDVGVGGCGRVCWRR